MSNISLLKEEFIVGIPIPRDPNDPSNMLPEQNFENLLKKLYTSLSVRVLLLMVLVELWKLES